MSHFVALSVSFVFSTCNTSQLMWHKNIQLCSRYIFSEMFLYMDYIFFCTHRLGHILHFSCLWFLAVKRSLTKFILSVYEGTMITGLRVTGLTIKTSVKPDRSVNSTKIKINLHKIDPLMNQISVVWLLLCCLVCECTRFYTLSPKSVISN